MVVVEYFKRLSKQGDAPSPDLLQSMKYVILIITSMSVYSEWIRIKH